VRLVRWLTDSIPVRRWKVAAVYVVLLLSTAIEWLAIWNEAR
jgi:hypothetical protein